MAIRAAIAQCIPIQPVITVFLTVVASITIILKNIPYSNFINFVIIKLFSPINFYDNISSNAIT
ncbi:hypothetical protein CBF85_01435 [Lactobacillus taiwanensis]|nr:hypothetical protein CBF85_01435 [Lactobacillus taiwanensis]